MEIVTMNMQSESSNKVLDIKKYKVFFKMRQI